MPRPGYLHPRGGGGQAAQSGEQDIPGYLRPRGVGGGGASCPGCKINLYTGTNMHKLK